MTGSTELTLIFVLIQCLLIIYCRYLYESHVSQSPISFVTNQFVGDSDHIVDEVKISPPEDETPDQFIDKGKRFK